MNNEWRTSFVYTTVGGFSFFFIDKTTEGWQIIQNHLKAYIASVLDWKEQCSIFTNRTKVSRWLNPHLSQKRNTQIYIALGNGHVLAFNSCWGFICTRVICGVIGNFDMRTRLIIYYSYCCFLFTWALKWTIGTFNFMYEKSSYTIYYSGLILWCSLDWKFTFGSDVDATIEP